MWYSGSFRPWAGSLTLLFIAPLAAGALRNPELLFLPLALLLGVACYVFLDRSRRPDRGATLPACLATLYVLTMPGLLTGAGARYYAFYYLLVILLFAQLRWLAGSNLALRLILVALSTIVALIGLVFAGHAMMAGALPTRTVLFAIYQTDYAEAVAYLTNVVGTSTTVALALLLLGFVALLARARPLAPHLPFTRHAVIFVPVALGLWATGDASNELRVLSTSLEYHQLLREYRRVAGERQTTHTRIEASRTRAVPQSMSS